MSGDVSSPLVALFGQTVFAYIDIAFLLVILLWLTVLVWVLKDSIARSKNIAFHVIAILLVTVLTPIFGLPLYLAIRPISYCQDRATARSMLISLTQTCPHCKAKNPNAYAFCFSCGHHLVRDCTHC